MLDPKFIREHPDIVKAGIKAKHDTDNIDEILSLDEKRRSIIGTAESLKS
jgi:seryl-tRNA synthetase